jgi:hypothetical protein
MPVSVRRYTELKLAISDYLQRRNWKRLFELCGTSDDETARTIAVILTLYDPRKVWGFLEYVFKMSPAERKEKRDSIATSCYVIGKIGQTRTEKALAYLRQFLLDDHMLRPQVMSALSNLWVLDTKRTSRIVMNNWVLNTEDNDDLEEIGVRSSRYLAENAPERVTPFLQKITKMNGERKLAESLAADILEESKIYAGNRKKKAKARLGKR